MDSFENKLEELKSIIERIENNNLTLEEVFASYEKGMGLAADLTKQLNEVTGKINELEKAFDSFKETEFDSEGISD